mgnify:FL=1
MAKISLIVPIYNTDKYLNKCLDSLISQSLKDIEIILINDGSTDDSEKIINNYDDKRIKYISRENKGVGKTRNEGIDLAKGEYLTFVDSDDYLDINFCKKMYEKAVKDNCDLVICDFFEDRGNLWGVKFKDFSDTNLKKNPELLNNINLGPCNKIYKNNLFKNKNNRFEENLKYEDAPFVVKMLISAKKIGKVNDYLTYYVVHDNSETTIRDKRIFDILKITDIIVTNLEKIDHPKKSIINLAVMILTDYTIQQRYVKSITDRHAFIDMAFDYLNKLDKSWRKCEYLKNFSKLKKSIKCNKTLTKIYCDFYNIKH